jgi:hypothetical protein
MVTIWLRRRLSKSRRGASFFPRCRNDSNRDRKKPTTLRKILIEVSLPIMRKRRRRSLYFSVLS